MNKRRRFGAKRRRRESKLKEFWLMGMSAADLFGRINSGSRPSILDRFRTPGPGWPKVIGTGRAYLPGSRELRLPGHAVHPGNFGRKA